MFTPGQHVISNGQLCIYEREATSIGEAPRLGRKGKPLHCAWALVTPVGSTKPQLVHRASLRSVADTVASDMTPPPPAAATPAPAAAAARRPNAISLIKAEALLAQADRIEGYAKTLRTEARALLEET